MPADALELFCQASRKRAVESLISDSDKQFANPTYGEAIPLQVANIVGLQNPQGQRLFQPLPWDGWTNLTAGIGNANLAPVAGVYYLLSGISLTSGTVTNAKRFKIIAFVSGDDFTNIGAASNASGVVFTSTGTTPTTWTHGSELQEITADLAYDALGPAIQTALNATAFITAAGGVVITGTALMWFITWNNDGAQSQMWGFAGDLAPLSIVEVSTLIDGSSTLAEVQALRVFQNVGAFCLLSTDSDAADVVVDEIQAGGGGLNAKYRITLTPSPYDGAFSILVAGLESTMIAFNANPSPPPGDTSGTDVQTILENISANSGLLVVGRKYTIVTFETSDDFTNVGAASNATGVVFTATGTTPTTWTHGSVLSPTGAGNVAVTREADYQYLVVFQGALTDTDMGSITGDPSGLQVIPYRLGTINLDTAGVELLLNGADTISTFFAITGIPPGESYPREILRIPVTINSAVIDPAFTTPTPSVLFPTLAGNNVFTGTNEFDQGILIGINARIIPITHGMKFQVATDGSTWQDGPSYTAS